MEMGVRAEGQGVENSMWVLSIFLPYKAFPQFCDRELFKVREVNPTSWQ